MGRFLVDILKSLCPLKPYMFYGPLEDWAGIINILVQLLSTVQGTIQSLTFKCEIHSYLLPFNKPESCHICLRACSHVVIAKVIAMSQVIKITIANMGIITIFVVVIVLTCGIAM